MLQSLKFEEIDFLSTYPLKRVLFYGKSYMRKSRVSQLTLFTRHNSTDMHVSLELFAQTIWNISSKFNSV
jgi:hypothetical protein